MMSDDPSIGTECCDLWTPNERTFCLSKVRTQPRGVYHVPTTDYIPDFVPLPLPFLNV